MKAKKLYPDINMYINNIGLANVAYQNIVQLPESNRNTENTTSDYFGVVGIVTGNICGLSVSIHMASTASERYTDYVVASGCPIPMNALQGFYGLLISNDGLAVSCYITGNGDLVVNSGERNVSGNHLHGTIFYLVDWKYGTLGFQSL